MKTLLLFLFLASASVLNAQCEFVRNEIDKFEKVKIVQTKQTNIWSPLGGGAFGLSYFYGGHTSFINLKVTTGSVFSNKEGSKAIFLFMDGGELVLEATSSGVADYWTDGKTTVWELRIDYVITTEQLIMLKTRPVTDVRVAYTNGAADYTPKKKGVKKLMAITHCFLDALEAE